MHGFDWAVSVRDGDDFMFIDTWNQRGWPRSYDSDLSWARANATDIITGK